MLIAAPIEVAVAPTRRSNWSPRRNSDARANVPRRSPRTVARTYTPNQGTNGNPVNRTTCTAPTAYRETSEPKPSWGAHRYGRRLEKMPDEQEKQRAVNQLASQCRHACRVAPVEGSRRRSR